MKTWHKVGLAVTVLLAITSWLIAIYYWGKLPTVIPTHFGFNGLPDSWNGKSVFYVFLMPFIQTLITLGFVFLYYKPQYSDMPTTLWLMTMEEHKRDHAFGLIRKMLIGTGLWIGVLFTYITFSTNIAGMFEPSPLIILGLVAAMMAWLVWWTVKVYRATKDAMKKEA